MFKVKATYIALLRSLIPICQEWHTPYDENGDINLFFVAKIRQCTIYAHGKSLTSHEDGTGESVDELFPRPPMLVAPGTSPEANGLQSSGQGIKLKQSKE